MDRARILELIGQEKTFVAEVEQQISHQKKVIAELSVTGRVTTGAKEFLSALETSLALHVARRDRLEQQLATSNPE